VERISAERCDAVTTRCPATIGPEHDGRTEPAASLERIRERLKSGLGGDAYARFFGSDARLDLTNGQLVVTVPTTYQANVIRKRFAEHLNRAVLDALPEAAAGHDAGWVVEVDRAVAPTAAATSPPVRRVPRPDASAPARRMRLDEFVVGESNRLAHAAAVRMAQVGLTPRGNARAALGFSSLFVHGECGMGKTHLLQGIAERFARLNPAAAVRCTTAETFTNEYILALREGRVDSFRRNHRRLDLLCIDDVHFVAGKESTQNELLHTLDAIDLDGALVALASDEHPRRVQRLGERLVSRFMSGMVVRIDPPDPELRVRLVAALAQRRGLLLDEPAARLMAERSAGPSGRGSVRDIEGLVVQVEAVCRLLPNLAGTDGRVGLAVVTKALGLSEGERAHTLPRPRRPVPIEAIADAACRSLRVAMPEFLGNGRHKRVVLARSITALLARQLTTASFPEIARAIGRPNHSTVVTAHQRLERMLRQEAQSGGSLLVQQFGPEFAGTTLRALVDRLHLDLARGN
jgi:chromosomal replication initiator protein